MRSITIKGNYDLPKFYRKVPTLKVYLDFKFKRKKYLLCTFLDKIYITGGFNGQECMNSVEVYDPDTNQWTNLAPMRSRRSGVSCIAYHNKVFRYSQIFNFLFL